jgi:hypothetical protein
MTSAKEISRRPRRVFPRIPQRQVKVLDLVGVYGEGLFVLAHCTEQQRPLLKQH